MPHSVRSSPPVSPNVCVLPEFSHSHLSSSRYLSYKTHISFPRTSMILLLSGLGFLSSYYRTTYPNSFYVLFLFLIQYPFIKIYFYEVYWQIPHLKTSLNSTNTHFLSCGPLSWPTRCSDINILELFAEPSKEFYFY